MSIEKQLILCWLPRNQFYQSEEKEQLVIILMAVILFIINH